MIMEQLKSNEKQFLRFSRLNRFLHVTMILCFLSLALTGMTLKFSYTGWAVFLSHLFGGFESAGYIHRVAAFFMLTIFIVHIVDLVRRKRKEFGTWRALLLGPDSMVFNKKDLKDLNRQLQVVHRQGAEATIWALDILGKVRLFCSVLGIFVIGSTGLMLWFPEFFTLIVSGMAHQCCNDYS